MEHWKEVVGYEGLYEVSSHGNVRSIERTIINKHGKPQRYPAKVLKPDVLVTEQTAYHRVTLSKDHKTTRFSVHRLVAIMFLPLVSDKPHVNHLDNDGLNNKVSNLE